MKRGSRFRALASGVGVAMAGAISASVLAGGRWAAVGAAVGAVTGSFAPSVYDAVRGRSAASETWRLVAERPVAESPARLLDPRRELVGFVGRQKELEALTAWCEDDAASPLRLVTGPGGVGKTRLTVELSRQLAAMGWRCERVGDGQEAKAVAALRVITGGRTLLVVDYAETRTGLRELLSALAADGGQRLRVLLLARSVDDWWEALAAAEPGVSDLVRDAQAQAIDLSPIVDTEVSDSEVVAQAVGVFARVLCVPAPAVEIEGTARGRRRMLDLHAAALVAVLDADRESGAEVARVDFGAVLDELLRHEQRFWYESARLAGLRDGPDGLVLATLRQIMAAACLLGASTEAQANSLLRRIPGLIPRPKIAKWLRALYPPDRDSREWLGMIQPDRLADLHTMRELAASPELTDSCLTHLDARQARRALSLFGRASADDPLARDLLNRIVAIIAKMLVAVEAPREVLEALVNVIPYPTVALAPAALALTRRIIGLLPDDTWPAERAEWLARLSTYYSAVGRPADALPVAEETVAIRRELADAMPHRYRPDLAGSLVNLSNRYMELGRPADAMPVTAEAVATFRELSEAKPDRYGPDLANSLANLSILHAELGRPTDALRVGEEAVAIRRELAASLPVSYRPDFARSLNNLSARYLAVGRRTDAVRVAEEAVAIRRELAASLPDRYRPFLANSLSNLGILYSELGQPADALPVAAEAVAICRELADAMPDRYNPDLARSLNNLSTLYGKQGCPADAMLVAAEAVAMFRELADAMPDRYRPDLAASLTNLSILHTELGRPADALPVAAEAVAIQRKLAASLPDRYRRDLASSLNRLAAILTMMAQDSDAEKARAEASRIQRAN